MKDNLKFAFIRTLPVLFGYLFLGLAFGLLLQKAGYNFIWAFFISLFVFAGSLQFVLIGFLTSGASIVSVIIMSLSINSRHIFYGLSFIEKFKSMGKAYPYMIFSLTDETYSLLCGTKVPKELNENKVFFLIALLDHAYWICGSVLGAVVGQLILFDTTGIEFAMTALFTVIFIEQWYSFKSHIPALVGILCGIICLIIVGPANFILPSLVVVIGILIIFKKPIQLKQLKEASK